MQYTEIVKSMQDLSESSFKEGAMFISLLKRKEKQIHPPTQERAANILRSFAGSLPQDFDENTEKRNYFKDKHGGT